MPSLHYGLVLANYPGGMHRMGYTHGVIKDTNIAASFEMGDGQMCPSLRIRCIAGLAWV